MDDLTLSQAIETLRNESEAEAAAISGTADEGIATAGKNAAHRVVSFSGAWVTIQDADEIVKIFEEEIQQNVSDAIGPILENAVATDIKSFATATGLPLRAAQLDDLATAMQFNLRFLPQLPKMVEPWLTDQMRGAVTGKVKTVEVIDGLRAKMDTDMKRYARTQVETTMQTMDQVTINAITADLGLDVFIYAGPDDIIARPFCHAMVNRAFPTEAIAHSSNGQIPNVMISRGGWNCRHRLRPARRSTLAYLKIPLIEPFRMETEIVSAGNPAKGHLPRVIVYPVKNQ